MFDENSVILNKPLIRPFVWERSGQVDPAIASAESMGDRPHRTKGPSDCTESMIFRGRVDVLWFVLCTTVDG